MKKKPYPKAPVKTRKAVKKAMRTGKYSEEVNVKSILGSRPRKTRKALANMPAPSRRRKK